MANSIQTVFLDMDGVLVDFFGAALHVHEREDLAAAWPPGVRDMAQVMGLSGDAFWRPIEALGASHWANLEPLPWMNELVALSREYGDMCILTSPHSHDACLAGKYTWLQQHLAIPGNGPFTDFVITRKKHHLARPNAVLIDDKESNIDAFRNAGGHAILFPQIWNKHGRGTSRPHVERPLAYVKERLDAIHTPTAPASTPKRSTATHSTTEQSTTEPPSSSTKEGTS